MRRFCLIFALLLGTRAVAALPSYTVQVQVTGSYTSVSGQGSSFYSCNPQINDAGAVASKINAAGPAGQDGIWFNGQLVYTADQAIGDVWLNTSSHITITHGVVGAVDSDY